MQLFDRGGPVMWPLLAGSIIGLSLIVERSWYFLRRRLPSSFETDLLACLRAGRWTEAQAMAAGNRHPVAGIARTYLENVDCPETLRQDILRREGSRRMEDAERNLRGLSLVAHLSPLLGLLGTVTGLVAAFSTIEQMQGMAQPAQLAAGIWESLLTTVFGLVIAIPCLAAFHLFEQRADRMARHMQFMISHLNEYFGKHENAEPLSAPAATDHDLNVVAS